MIRSTVVVGISVLAIAGLGACSSSSDAPAASVEPVASEAATAAAASPSAEASMVGGMATCDETTFVTAVKDLLVSEGDGNTLFSLDGFECADGYAVTFPTVGPDEDSSYTYTQVFQAEGQFWIPVDRGDVCGTTSLDDPTAYPADAQIPESIWQPACNTN